MKLNTLNEFTMNEYRVGIPPSQIKDKKQIKKLIRCGDFVIIFNPF